jgi:hypothetical protein
MSARHPLATLARTALAALAATLLPLGCKPAPTPATNTSSKPANPQYPRRPTVPPPPFKVFHHDDTSITLVTDTNASDKQIESLIWQLRDAAHTRTLDQLPTLDKQKISQQAIDARKPIVWFHIYRGPKCASEKYASGPPPCGSSYHAAGDYTYGGYKNREADSGLLLHDENHQTDLWNPDIPYSPPQPGGDNRSSIDSPPIQPASSQKLAAKS